MTAGSLAHAQEVQREYEGYGWLCEVYPTGDDPEGLRSRVYKQWMTPGAET
ncbi:hypothetical protein ACWD26_29145 [Streptomyces sp. NPDC002787]